MLRIDLLPKYVAQRRLTKTLVPVFIGIFLLSVAVPLGIYYVKHEALVKLTSDAADAVAGKAKTDALKTQATTTLAQIGPIQAKLQFVKDSAAFYSKWVALYNTLAETTPKSSFIYSGAAVSGTTMTIKAYSPSVEEVGRYLQTMYHEPDFTTVAVDKIPAYPENIRHLYFLDKNLVFADGAGGNAAPSAAPTGRGFGGGAPTGGAGTTGAPSNWTPDAFGPNSPTNIPPGVGPPPPEIAVGGPATAGGQAGGGTGPGASASYGEKFLRVAGRNISPFASPEIRDLLLRRELHRVKVVTVSKGFDINVTATLKEPLTAPVPPGGPAAPAAGGPGGFRGGPPPGAPPGRPA